MKQIWCKLTILVLPFVMIFVPVFLLNYSGFCLFSMKWLSKKEKIEAVFNYYNGRKILSVDIFKNGMLTIKSYNHIQYSSFEEYIKKYPNCCIVNPPNGYDLASPSFMDRISGFNSGDVVVIEFAIRYLDKNNRIKNKKFTAENFISNCGKAYQ
ncbi:hypothetical protein VKI22_12065 [Cyanobacterium aponinum UTEX 3221]|uniref:hypothetical protein n=1 Tax=Cyanobacterium aponinum TaxID=379064 RepID=UPI00168176AA|nr:hypothetical protein [Cyanobacterium aponinum]MBD2394775.1 hypothetical protein [Cyanobacterium aponinum FACHB-4101]WRL37360.1 hypothetical protein VKI22_12065 [Cyanobacterium aponinum UTEX 3221]